MECHQTLRFVIAPECPNRTQAHYISSRCRRTPSELHNGEALSMPLSQGAALAAERRVCFEAAKWQQVLMDNKHSLAVCQQPSLPICSGGIQRQIDSISVLLLTFSRLQRPSGLLATARAAQLKRIVEHDCRLDPSRRPNDMCTSNGRVVEPLCTKLTDNLCE